MQWTNRLTTVLVVVLMMQLMVLEQSDAAKYVPKWKKQVNKLRRGIETG